MGRTIIWKWCRQKDCWAFQTKVMNIFLRTWWTWITFNIVWSATPFDLSEECGSPEYLQHSAMIIHYLNIQWVLLSLHFAFHFLTYTLWQHSGFEIHGNRLDNHQPSLGDPYNIIQNFFVLIDTILFDSHIASEGCSVTIGHKYQIPIKKIGVDIFIIWDKTAWELTYLRPFLWWSKISFTAFKTEFLIVAPTTTFQMYDHIIGSTSFTYKSLMQISFIQFLSTDLFCNKNLEKIHLNKQLHPFLPLREALLNPLICSDCHEQSDRRVELKQRSFFST